MGIGYSSMGFESSDKCINRLKIICIYSSEYAFNPKSEKQRFKLNSSQSKAEDLRQSIEERIKRQTSLLSNEVSMISFYWYVLIYLTLISE